MKSVEGSLSAIVRFLCRTPDNEFVPTGGLPVLWDFLFKFCVVPGITVLGAAGVRVGVVKLPVKS